MIATFKTPIRITRKVGLKALSAKQLYERRRIRSPIPLLGEGGRITEHNRALISDPVVQITGQVRSILSFYGMIFKYKGSRQSEIRIPHRFYDRMKIFNSLLLDIPSGLKYLKNMGPCREIISEVVSAYCFITVSSFDRM